MKQSIDLSDTLGAPAVNPERRRFLLSTGALGVAALAPSRSLFAAGAKKGGRLVIAIPGGASSDSLDPRTFTSLYMGTHGFMFGNCLTEIGVDGELVGELAESWEGFDSASRWRFNLRKGVTFHDGREMTSEDVVWSLNQHRSDNTKSAAKALVSSITEIKTDGKYAIQMSLDAPNADLPFALSDFHLLILPAGDSMSSGNGTGPYQIKKFTPGISATATRNPNYWKAGRAHADEIELINISDPAARSSALITGEVDIINRVDLKTVHLLEKQSGVQIFNFPGPGHRPMLMLCDQAPFDDPDLRLAVKYAVDRKEILEKIVRGYGTIGNDHPIPPFDPFFAADLPQRHQDLDKAKFHLKKSGFTGAVQLHASPATHPEAIDMATLFAEHAKSAGLKVQIKPEPADGYWSNVWMKMPFIIGAWGGRPTADIMLSTAYKSDAKWNDTRWQRDRFDKLLLQARGELDNTKRKAMYREMQSMIRDDGGACITYFANQVDAGKSTVGGFVAGNFELSGMRAPERCWLEA